MDINKDAWRYWYPRKEEAVDENIPKLERIFRKSGVSRILDLGCGTGRHTIYFAEEGFIVYGFDFSSYAIQRLTERLKRRNVSAHLMIWDMSKKFPYENEFFDAVIAIRVIHHAPLRVIKHVVSEVSRITRKGGYFYAKVPTLEKDFWAKGRWKELGTRIPLEGPEKGIPHHGFTKLELLELSNSNNFKVKDIYEKDEHFCLLAVKRQKPALPPEAE